MTKSYNELDSLELKLEKKRLELILQSHPKPLEYKQAKKSLERINNLIARKVANLLCQNTN